MDRLPNKSNGDGLFCKIIVNFQWRLQTIDIFNGHQITSELDNDLLKSLKFTMFSENNRYFLVSQFPFSILIMLFCSKGNFATASRP